MKDVGESGQKKLLKAKVLIIGCGGLGSPCAYYLAGAGIGEIGLVDPDSVEISNLQRQILHFMKADSVEISNLQRQILHFMKDIGRKKVESAREKLEAVNSDVKVVTYPVRLTPENIGDVIKKYDIIVDASDNFPTKYLINDACVKTGKPYSHAAVLKFEGQATTVIPRQGPCYRCIFPEPPPAGMVPSPREAGILGTVAGVLGMIQATEVLKYILGKGELLTGKLIIFNALEMNFRKLDVKRNVNCPVCGKL